MKKKLERYINETIIDSNLQRIRFNKYMTSEEAIKIASNDRKLKDSIYKEGLKKKMAYGLIIFQEFGVKLIKYKEQYAWYIKVLKGEWGASKRFCLLDGDFDENSNIACLVLIENGEYIYFDKSMIKDIKDIFEEEYKRDLIAEL